MTLRTPIFALAAAAFLFMGTGCSDSKVAAQRDDLIKQNQQLQANLQSEQAARQAAESRANAQLSPTDPTIPNMGGPLAFNGRPTPTPTRTSATPARPTNNTPSHTSTTSVIRPTVTAHTVIGGNVQFASGKVSLDAAATKQLDTIASTIKTKHKGDKVVVEGFADNTPLSKTSVWTSNADLAKARATAVKNYLVKKGIPAADITVKGTTTSSTGAASRKVEVAVAG